MKKIVTLLFMVSFANCLSAQSFTDFASFYEKTEDVKVNQLNFRLESMGFFQNNEYLGNIVNGYTLTGAMFRPKLSYSPVAGLYIEAGVHLIKYNGKDQPVNTAPWVSARYCFSDQFSVITGNLDQNKQHGLPEQLWEPERIYTDKPEAGLQFLYAGKRLDAQTWVSWEQFIQKDDSFQEHFTAGVTANYKVIENSALTVKLPVNLLFYHQGGEINSGVDGQRPQMQTHANVSAGGEIAVKFNAKKVKSLVMNYYWLGYKAMTEDSSTQPFTSGHAHFLEIGFTTRNSKISVGSWDAFQFIAPKGREIYQSVSEIDPSFNEAKRSLFSAKYYWQKNITKDARVAFHVEAYLVNAPMGALSYSYGFFLLLNSDFLLKSFK